MTNQKPIHTIRDGMLAASIWRNEAPDGKTIYNVSFSRSYMKEDTWQTAFSYARSDILKIARLAEQAYDWINAKPRAERLHLLEGEAA